MQSYILIETKHGVARIIFLVRTVKKSDPSEKKSDGSEKKWDGSDFFSLPSHFLTQETA